MVEEVSKQQMIQLSQNSQDQKATDDLLREINALKKRLDQKSKELEDLKDKDLDRRLILKEKVLELKRQEDREGTLISEIQELKRKNRELEEKLISGDLDGNNHLGLSRIEFLGQASRHSNSKKTVASSKNQKPSKNQSVTSKPLPTKGKWVVDSSDISKNSSLIADLGTLKISEASQRLESSDFKESDAYLTDQVETGLTLNLQKSAIPENDVEVTSSFI